MRIVIAITLSLVCGSLSAANYTKEECVDGFAVAVVFDSQSSPQAVHGYQLLAASGKPKICGERKKQADLKAVKLQTNVDNFMQTISIRVK